MPRTAPEAALAIVAGRHGQPGRLPPGTRRPQLAVSLPFQTPIGKKTPPAIRNFDHRVSQRARVSDVGSGCWVKRKAVWYPAPLGGILPSTRAVNCVHVQVAAGVIDAARVRRAARPSPHHTPGPDGCKRVRERPAWCPLAPSVVMYTDHCASRWAASPSAQVKYTGKQA